MHVCFVRFLADSSSSKAHPSDAHACGPDACLQARLIPAGQALSPGPHQADHAVQRRGAIGAEAQREVGVGLVAAAVAAAAARGMLAMH